MQHLSSHLVFVLLCFLMGFAVAVASASELVINDGEFTCALDPSVPVAINASTGDLEVTLLNTEACFGPPGGPPTVPLEPALELQVLQSQAPGSVRVTWSSSEGASSCTASSSPTLAAWSGDVSLGQNQSQEIPQIPAGSYTLRLRCANSAGDSPNAQDSFTISAPAAPEACTNRPPPSGWTRMSTGSLSCRYDNSGRLITGADCRTWSPGIWPSTFLNTGGLTERLGTRGGQNQYMAIQFDTTGLTSTRIGHITASESGAMNQPRFLWTISECPGDFNPTQPTGCYGALVSVSPTIFWGGTGTSRACRLEANRTYFLNLIATNVPLGTPPENITLSPDCPEGRPCGAVFSPQNQ